MEVFGDLRNGIKGQKNPCVFLGPFISSAELIISMEYSSKPEVTEILCRHNKNIYT